MAIGQNITIYVGGLVVVKARDCTWEELGEVVDVSGMDDDWDDNAGGSLSWRMTMSKIWTPAKTAYAALRTAFLARTAVVVKWVDATGRGRRGSALVARMGEGFGRNEPVISNIEVTGDGAPTDDPDYGS